VVARRLDISGRTLQRRVTALIRAAGVGNRLQLGWYAASHGWVPAAKPVEQRP
jgi:DNA-binding NarL/FixJ family response regulator